MVAVIQKRVTWPPMGNGVARSVELEASGRLEVPALLEEPLDTQLAVTDSKASRCCLFGYLETLETELEMRAAVAGRAGSERRTAGAIPC
jgi:hypothetical protein